MEKDIEKEMQEQQKQETCCEETTDEKTTMQQPSLEEQVEALQKELDKAKNDYFKAYADADNMKKRLQNDYETLSKYRAQSFISEIIPVIDNFERALSMQSEDEKIINFKKGFEMIYEQLKTALVREGVEEINALNTPFDPNFHQALQSETVEGVEPNMVVEQFQKGYKLKDRILRAALVKVSE